MTKTLPLTPLEQTRAEKKAYDAWLEKQAIYNPAPEPDSRDIVHDNPAVTRALAWAVSMIPVFLALIMFSAMFISADRTFTAFSGAAAHGLPVWAGFIGLLGVIFTEGSLIFAEFAAVRSRLQRNLPRQVWTVPKFMRAVAVRLGLKNPLDYDEMPDNNLERFSSMVFVLVLAANVFVATMPLLEANGTAWAVMTDLARIKLLFAIFMGVVAPFGLKFVGGQLAELSYSLYAQQRADMRLEMQKQWKAEMMSMWEQEGPQIVAQALHATYARKNGLPPGAQSPYLLMTGMDEEGKPEIQATPLAPSWTASQNAWHPTSTSESGDGLTTP